MKASTHKSPIGIQPRLAIVSTIKNPGALLSPFIEYHLSIGFDRLFLFFDDASDASIGIARRYESVTVLMNDADLERKWKAKSLYRQFESVLDVEMMARQRLNVEVALDLAAQDRVNWLLHIDVDELFYSPAASAKDHFKKLEIRGVFQSLYLNCEAIPEVADITNPFVEATLFKVHPLALPNKKLNQKQLSVIDGSPHLMPNRFFFYHMDTKAAAMLVPGVTTSGVHKFGFEIAGPPTLRARVACRLRRLFRQIRSSRIKRLFMKALETVGEPQFGRRTEVSPDSRILHYPSCGFQQFVDRYMAWGAFPDTIWGGKASRTAIASPVNQESRDVFSKGDLDLAREFYEKRFVMSDKEEVRRLMEAVLVRRIEGPSDLLRDLLAEKTSFQRGTDARAQGQPKA